MCTCRSHRCSTLFGLPLKGSANSCLAGELPIRRRDWLAVAGSAAAWIWASPGLAAAKLYGTPVRYDYVSSGVVKGSQTTLRLPDGSFDVRYEYIDRGRGPKLRSTIRCDETGFISSLRTTGYNYLKVAVEERFTSRNGAASWQNSAERESHRTTSPRFYISMEGTPEEGAIMVRAALRAQRTSLPLWPSGVTNVSAVKTIAVSNGAASRRVTMYEASGLDFAPAQLWLDENGELFMSGISWGAVIRSGWDSVLPRLLDAQNERVDELGRQLARTLPQRSGTAIAMTNVSLFDSERGEIVGDATVIFHGEAVAAVGTSGTAVPSDARRIDGTE